MSSSNSKRPPQTGVSKKGDNSAMCKDQQGDTKRKGKGRDFTSIEMKDRNQQQSAMGCASSQAVIIQSPPDPSQIRNANLQPTIFMVAQENFQMLRELGELKLYHLAQPNVSDTEETERIHHDMISRLENPVYYEREEQARSESYNRQTIVSTAPASTTSTTQERPPKETNSSKSKGHADDILNEGNTSILKKRTEVNEVVCLPPESTTTTSCVITGGPLRSTTSLAINTTGNLNAGAVLDMSDKNDVNFISPNKEQCPTNTDGAVHVQPPSVCNSPSSETAAKNTFFARRNRIEPTERHNDDNTTTT